MILTDWLPYPKSRDAIASKKAENKSTHIHSFCNFRDPVQNTIEVCDNAGDTLANSEMEESKITVEMMDTKLL